MVREVLKGLSYYVDKNNYRKSCHSKKWSIWENLLSKFGISSGLHYFCTIIR